MEIILRPILFGADMLLNIYLWFIIASVILSWLIAFNVINTSNRFVYTVGEFLHRLTEPALRPIRNFMPNLGGIDISPLILIVAIYVIRSFLMELSRSL